MQPINHEQASVDVTKRKLVAVLKCANALFQDNSALALVPLELHISIVNLAHMEVPEFPETASRGAAKKDCEFIFELPPDRRPRSRQLTNAYTFVARLGRGCPNQVACA
jgi:hypothetical protein